MLVIYRCQDYILIDSGPFGTTELCGNTTTVLELQIRNFTVYFRTSEEGRRRGFEMFVVCFNPGTIYNNIKQIHYTYRYFNNIK